MWLTPCYYAVQCGVSTHHGCTQSVKLMDTRVTEGQECRKQSWLARVYGPNRQLCWWCAILCAWVCGCNLLKTAQVRQTAEPPVSPEVASNDNQVAAPPPAPAPSPATAATTSLTPQSPSVRTSIADPQPAPALNPVPKARPAKSNQILVVPDASPKVLTGHTFTKSIAKIPRPQTTVTYIPREAAAAIVIKGPPRPPQPTWSRIAVPLCFGIGIGAGLVAIAFTAKQRFVRPSVGKGRKEELFLPSEFKLRDSVIEPGAPFGMLAPEKPVCRSKLEGLVSVLGSTTNAIRFLASKLRIGTACRAVWRRITTVEPAITEQGVPTSLSTAATDSKSAENVAKVQSADGDGQSKADESKASRLPADSAVSARQPVTAARAEPLPASEDAGKAISTPP
jgi:hypothetical protein